MGPPLLLTIGFYPTRLSNARLRLTKYPELAEITANKHQMKQWLRSISLCQIPMKRARLSDFAIPWAGRLWKFCVSAETCHNQLLLWGQHHVFDQIKRHIVRCHLGISKIPYNAKAERNDLYREKQSATHGNMMPSSVWRVLLKINVVIQIHTSVVQWKFGKDILCSG